MHDDTEEPVEEPVSPEPGADGLTDECAKDVIYASGIESPFVLPGDSVIEPGPREEDQKPHSVPMDQSSISNTTVATLRGTQLLQSRQADNAFLTDFVLDTKLFSSGLDEATLTGSLYHKIDPANRREFSDLILNTKKIVYKSASTVFNKLRGNIDDRKLFVMFESILDCNPKYDHLNPKSTLPIFSPFLEEAEASIYNLILPQLYHEIEATVARTLEADMLRKQTMIEEVEDLRRMVDELQNQLVEFELGVSQSATLNALDRKVLIQRIITLKEQLHWRGRMVPDSSNVQYKPDYMDIKQSRGRSWEEDLEEELDEEAEGVGTDKQLLCLKNRRLLKELEDDVKLLERKIEEKRQLIAQLNAKNELMEAEIKRLTGVLDATDERHRQLRMLKKESDELDRLLAEMHANYDAKMKEMENLQKRYTKGIEEAEQRTAALANKLKSSHRSEQPQTSSSSGSGTSKKNGLEMDKLRDQIEKLSNALAAKDKEIEQLKLGSRKETKTESTQATPLSPHRTTENAESLSALVHQLAEEDSKERSENTRLIAQVKEQSDEIDKLRKQLEQVTAKLSETESALQKERTSEKVPLDDSILSHADSSNRKDHKKTSATKSTGCGPDLSLSKGPSNSAGDSISDCKDLTPEEEELLRGIDSSMVFNRALVVKARTVLQAAIDLNKHRAASLKTPTSTAILSTKKRIDDLRQSVVSLLEEREFEGLLDAHREDITDLTTIQNAAKAAKEALCNYRDASVGVNNGVDDDRHGSVGDDWEADGYNAQINRASHAADSILKTRKGTRGFQIHYNSRTIDLNRPDDVFSRLYNLAETTKKKLGEKRKAYLAELSEKEAHRMRYRMQAADTIATVVNTTIGLIGKSLASTTDLTEAKLAVRDTFAELLGAVLSSTDVSASSVAAVIDEVKQKVAVSLASLQKAGASEVTTTSAQLPPPAAAAETSAVPQPILQVSDPGTLSAPNRASLQISSELLRRSTSLSINSTEGLTVQCLSSNDPTPSKDAPCKEDYHPPDMLTGLTASYNPSCIVAPLAPIVTPLELPIYSEDLCTSSALRSFPSRNNQQRPTNVSGRTYLFDSFGDVVGFISSAGHITFYGEYAQYSTHNRIISDISDTTCSLLSSRGSSKSSSRVTSRAGSAKQKSSPQYTYMLQKINICDPSIAPHSCHTAAVQTELTLLSNHQSRIDYLSTEDSNSYRHKMVYNYKDMPLGNVFSADLSYQTASATPANTLFSFSANGARPSSNQSASYLTEHGCSIDGAPDTSVRDSVYIEPKQGIKRSSSCIILGGSHHALQSYLITAERDALSDRDSFNYVSGSEPPHLQHLPPSFGDKEENMRLMERRAKSVGERTRRGFQAVDAKTGRLDVSAEEALELEKQLTRLADSSLINPEKIGSTIQKPTLLIYDTDTAPIRYRKAVEYMSGIGGDPKDINIMAVVTESGEMLRNPDAINSLSTRVESTPLPLVDSKSSSAAIHDALAPQIDTVSGDHVCVSPALSVSGAPQPPCACPDSDIISECSVCEDSNSIKANQPGLTESKLGTSLSNETAHKKLLSSFTDLLKKRDDAFLVRSYNTSQMYDSTKKISSDTQSLLTVKVVSNSFEGLPCITSSSRSGSVEPFKALPIQKDRSKSISGTSVMLSPRMKVEDLDAIPLLESKCYLNDVTEKSLMRASAARGSIPSLSALRDSRGNPLIFNDRMVDDAGQLHSINLHKDGWEHMRGSFSSNVMKQQAVNKLKTLTNCSAQLKINSTSNRVADPPLLVSNTNTSGIPPTKPLPKSIISRGASAGASRRIAQPPESLQPKAPLRPL